MLFRYTSRKHCWRQRKSKMAGGKQKRPPVLTKCSNPWQSISRIHPAYHMDYLVIYTLIQWNLENPWFLSKSEVSEIGLEMFFGASGGPQHAYVVGNDSPWPATHSAPHSTPHCWLTGLCLRSHNHKKPTEINENQWNQWKSPHYSSQGG